jgi:hypothetical protein
MCTGVIVIIATMTNCAPTMAVCPASAAPRRTCAHAEPVDPAGRGVLMVRVLYRLREDNRGIDECLIFGFDFAGADRC